MLNLGYNGSIELVKMEPGELKDRVLERLRDSGVWKYLPFVLLLSLPFLFWPRYSLAFGLMVTTFLVSFATTRLELSSLGVELATFSTVMIGAVFGPATGAAAGLVFIMAQFAGSTSQGVYIMWVIPGYIAAGALAGILGASGIERTGPLIALGLQSFFVLSTSLLTPEELGRYLPYAVFNVVFNAAIFQLLAPLFVQVAA